jgi:hypothetical protein
VVQWVYKDHDVVNEYTFRRAVELETARQFFWSYSRSASKTLDNIKSGVGFIQRFGAEMDLQVVPTVQRPDFDDTLPAAWLLCQRVQDVKVQSLSSTTAALTFLSEAVGATNRHSHPVKGEQTMTQRVKLGMAHVLGIEIIPTARFTLAVVQELQDLLLAQARGTSDKEEQLYFYSTALYVLLCFLGFLRPNEPSKLYLKGMVDHFFVGRRARRLGITKEYMGLAFGFPKVMSKGRRTTGGQTKNSRTGAKVDLDTRGSEVVFLTETFSGLIPGQVLVEVCLLRGVDPFELDTTLIPNSEPLFSDEHGKPLRSSEGNHPFLPRVRRALLELQARGDVYELVDVDVDRVSNYWLKISGDTEALARMVPEPLCRHFGRWRPNAREPRNMEVKYRQPLLRELLTVSDHGHTWRHSHTLQ